MWDNYTWCICQKWLSLGESETPTIDLHLHGTLSLKILVELDYIYLGLKYAFVVQLRTETLMSRWMGT